MKYSSEHTKSGTLGKVAMEIEPRAVVNVLLVSLLSLLGAGLSQAEQFRAFTPEDLLRLEGFQSVALSPDGDTLAYVRLRPWDDRVRKTSTPIDRSDVWLAPVVGGMPRNITNGGEDGSGWWEPVWSPDGTKLAMLSNRGEVDNVRVWIWDSVTDRLSRLSDRGVAWGDVIPTLSWLDSQRIVTVLEPNGEKTQRYDPEHVLTRKAPREWKKAFEGKESTAIVLESGIAIDMAARPQRSLVILSMSGGVVAMGQSPQIKFVKMSPDRRRIAFMRQVDVVQPTAVTPLKTSPRLTAGTRYDDRYELAIARVDGTGEAVVSSAKYAVPESFVWSDDGQAFAFVGVKRGNNEAILSVFRGDVLGQVQEVTFSRSQEPQSVKWIGSTAVLIASTWRSSPDDATIGRRDWWIVAPNETPRQLSASLGDLPDNLWLAPGGHDCLGLADGDLWRLSSDRGNWTNVTRAFEPRISNIVWPTSVSAPGSDDLRVSWEKTYVVLAAMPGQSRAYYRIDVSSGSVLPLRRPSAHAQLAAYLPEKDVAAFIAVERDGTALISQKGDKRQTIAEVNTFLRNVAEGEQRVIDYASLDGEPLKGLLILPTRYESGKRYPLVAWVYPGHVVERKSADDEDDEGLIGVQAGLAGKFVNGQLFAAHGYAVLIPSIPLKGIAAKNGIKDDPLLQMTNGVLPAIDKVVELGVANPARLAVAGLSGGGFGAYALVTQTMRFKAAVAINGFVDLSSWYGIFPASKRYDRDDHVALTGPSYLEDRAGRMGDAPWSDAGRYLRNSPMFYVDRVRTPMLIIHGDVDTICDITGAEQFFSALYRLGERAKFVRYAGEAHGLTSPANVRDMWRQIYEWLDDFLRERSGSKSTM